MARLTRFLIGRTGVFSESPLSIGPSSRLANAPGRAYELEDTALVAKREQELPLEIISSIGA